MMFVVCMDAQHNVYLCLSVLLVYSFSVLTPTWLPLKSSLDDEYQASLQAMVLAISYQLW